MSHSAVPDYSTALQRISIAILAMSAIVVAGTFYVHHTRSVDGASVSIEPAEWPESLRSLLGEAKLDSTGLQVSDWMRLSTTIPFGSCRPTNFVLSTT